MRTIHATAELKDYWELKLNFNPRHKVIGSDPAHNILIGFEVVFIEIKVYNKSKVIIYIFWTCRKHLIVFSKIRDKMYFNFEEINMELYNGFIRYINNQKMQNKITNKLRY